MPHFFSIEINVVVFQPVFVRFSDIGNLSMLKSQGGIAKIGLLITLKTLQDDRIVITLLCAHRIPKYISKYSPLKFPETAKNVAVYFSPNSVQCPVLT